MPCGFVPLFPVLLEEDDDDEEEEDPDAEFASVHEKQFNSFVSHHFSGQVTRFCPRGRFLVPKFRLQCQWHEATTKMPILCDFCFRELRISQIS